MSRNTEMISKFKSGATLQEVADLFSISKQRVSQILKAHGVSRCEGGAMIRRINYNLQNKKETKDERFIRKYGCTSSQYGELPWRAISAFRNQKHSAKSRGIGWELTLFEWYTEWVNSGFWEQRGKAKYVMARRGDVGPYAIGNIYFCTSSQNIKDSYVNKPAHARKKKTKKHYTPQDAINAVKLVEGGMTRAAAAKQCGIGRLALGKLCREAGLVALRGSPGHAKGAEKMLDADQDFG